MSLENPQSYRYISDERGMKGGSSEESYRKLNEPDEA